MKRINVLLVLLLCITSFVSAQVPQKFSYQAVLRNNGEIIQSTDVTIKASLLSGSPDGTSVYSETHDVTTTAQGVVALSVGDGVVASGVFSQIPWEENIFLKIEVKIGSDDYIEMGTSQILSVPYSLRADRATYADSAIFANSALTATSLENGTIEIAPAEGHNASDPIFSVKNADGNLVFAVFEDGVRSYVTDLSKSANGGFIVGGLTEGNPEFFIVSPDSTRVYVDETAKGPRSGFAVGGRAGQKDEAQTYFNVTPALTEIYFDTTLARGPRSGFAVGGRAGQKDGEAQTYLAVTPLLTEVYFDNTTTAKGARSGFAVGGRAGQKDVEASPYLEVTPTLTSVYIDETTEKGPRSGFAVGGRAGQKSVASDILFVSPDSTRVYVDDESRGPRSGFAVGGRAGMKGTGLHYLQVTPDSTRIVVGNTTTKASELGGFTVGGVTPEGTFTNYLTVTEQSAVFNTDIHSEGNLLIGGTVTQTTNAQDSVVDVEGNKYGAVKIGEQIWMSQNLRTMTYNDGTAIEDTLAVLSTSNPEVFGVYYSWYAVNNNICPTGWHVADSADWGTLFTGLGGQYYGGVNNSSYLNVVDQLLAPNSDWSITPSNSTGFSVFNAGVAVYAEGSWYIQTSEQTSFWSSTNTLQYAAVKGEYPQQIIFMDGAVTVSAIDTEVVDAVGSNIRCVKDE